MQRLEIVPLYEIRRSNEEALAGRAHMAFRGNQASPFWPTIGMSEEKPTAPTPGKSFYSALQFCVELVHLLLCRVIVSWQGQRSSQDMLRLKSRIGFEHLCESCGAAGRMRPAAASPRLSQALPAVLCSLCCERASVPLLDLRLAMNQEHLCACRQAPALFRKACRSHCKSERQQRTWAIESQFHPAAAASPASATAAARTNTTASATPTAPPIALSRDSQSIIASARCVAPRPMPDGLRIRASVPAARTSNRFARFTQAISIISADCSKQNTHERARVTHGFFFQRPEVPVQVQTGDIAVYPG